MLVTPAMNPPAQVATWYARGLRHPDRLTAASRVYPRGSKLEVSRMGRTIRVVVNDYGPEEHTGADIDLSRGAFEKLAPLRIGRIIVQVKVVYDPRKPNREGSLCQGQD